MHWNMNRDSVASQLLESDTQTPHILTYENALSFGPNLGIGLGRARAFVWNLFLCPTRSSLVRNGGVLQF